MMRMSISCSAVDNDYNNTQVLNLALAPHANISADVRLLGLISLVGFVLSWVGGAVFTPVHQLLQEKDR